jgi:hypothetical protein
MPLGPGGGIAEGGISTSTAMIKAPVAAVAEMTDAMSNLLIWKWSPLAVDP